MGRPLNDHTIIDNKYSGSLRMIIEEKHTEQLRGLYLESGFLESFSFGGESRVFICLNVSPREPPHSGKGFSLAPEEEDLLVSID
jgi:hypothetical protein